MIKRPSPNFNQRPAGSTVDMLVLHYTGMPSAEDALARLCDPVAEVSAHYVIDEDGSTYLLVIEEHRAWHAGVAAWQGNTNINDRSIGIELVNPGHEFGYRSFSDVQMTTLVSLAGEIISRHSIAARNVVGHSDVAPTRKQDPGELFDWARLADQGVGLWPESDTAENLSTDFGAALEQYGYDIADLAAATTAFQRHFRPAICDGVADAETLNILQDLLNQSGH
ncbi:MAG: N-acetylmuramoyl-L-alanine amidase [Rhodospirillaceae bacterium]|nr:N-acetylmuramoyl-L-alanine amidase [Rhodospirillaceae bacterium]MBT7954309.1 N-acetylmuramoyl-L-alanine amidase [Rhodospirillaceae bacterium]